MPAATLTAQESAELGSRLLAFERIVRDHSWRLGIMAPNVGLASEKTNASAQTFGIFGRSSISIGAHMLVHLSDRALASLAVHELTHLKRNDAASDYKLKKRISIFQVIASTSIVAGSITAFGSLKGRVFEYLNAFEHYLGIHPSGFWFATARSLNDALTLLAYSFVALQAMAITATVSRYLKYSRQRANELKADREAVKSIGIRPYLELLEYTKTFMPDPKGIRARLFESHPSYARRSRKMKAYARRNGIIE